MKLGSNEGDIDVSVEFRKILVSPIDIEGLKRITCVRRKQSVLVFATADAHFPTGANESALVRRQYPAIALKDTDFTMVSEVSRSP